MAVVTPADCPKSVRNRCVIEVLVAFLCLSLLFFFKFSGKCKGLCDRTESDIFLFLFMYTRLVFYLNVSCQI